MSWDIYIMSAPAGASTLEEVGPEEADIEPLGSRQEVHNAILAVFPNADLSDPAWGVFDGDGYSIEFNMGSDNTVGGMMLHVRGGDDAIPAIKALCDHTGWRAYDIGTGEFMGFDAASEESRRRWQEYRDRVVES